MYAVGAAQLLGAVLLWVTGFVAHGALLLAALIADKAFDADERVLVPLTAADETAVIPPRPTAAGQEPSTATSTKLAI